MAGKVLGRYMGVRSDLVLGRYMGIRSAASGMTFCSVLNGFDNAQIPGPIDFGINKCKLLLRLQ